MYHYLGYEFVPGPATMFRGSGSCPPARSRVARAAGLEIEPYWELRFERTPRRRGRPARRVRETLRDSVHAWMMSDVPEGVFLSGGLDSTAVLAFTREATTGPLPTFTLGYDDPSSASGSTRARRRATMGPSTARSGAPGHARRDRADRLAPRRADDRPVGGAALPAVPGGARATSPSACRARAGTRSSSAMIGSSRRRRTASTGCCPGALRRGVIEPLVTRLPDQEQKKGRSSSCAGSSRAPASTPTGFTCAGSTSARPSATELFRETVLRVGRPRPLRADPQAGSGATPRGSSTARSSWTPGSRCRTRC